MKAVLMYPVKNVFMKHGIKCLLSKIKRIMPKKFEEKGTFL